MTIKKCREFGEIEYRDGERRSSCVILPCNDVVKLEAEVRLNREASKEALEIQTKELSRRLDETNNHLRFAADDRVRFFTNAGHDLFKENLDVQLKEVRKVIEKNSERLTVIETAQSARTETVRAMMLDERNRTRNAILIMGIALAIIDLIVRFLVYKS